MITKDHFWGDLITDDKIVGLRGAGKSVEYSLILNHFKSKKNWLVYALSSGEDPIQTLISGLSKEKFIDSKVRTESYGAETTVSGNIAIASRVIRYS